MIKIKYKIKEVFPNVFAVVVKNDYQRGMLFCKVQEFYECSNKKFINKRFSIWEFQQWYAKKNKGVFSYPSDYEGFNVPLEIAVKFQRINAIETPYDKKIKEITDTISSTRKKAYIIGVKSLRSRVFKHELCHALYFLNKDYKKDADKITNSLNKKEYKRFVANLKKLGYNKNVIKDEIQAYMATDVDERVLKNICNKNSLHKRYKSVLSKYSKKRKKK